MDSRQSDFFFLEGVGLWTKEKTPSRSTCLEVLGQQGHGESGDLTEKVRMAARGGGKSQQGSRGREVNAAGPGGRQPPQHGRGAFASGGCGPGLCATFLPAMRQSVSEI